MSRNKNLVLAAMVFAVAMTFIDQTIVAIAIPNIQRELSLSATGSQWVINGYLLALSALFAFGGKLGDVLGRRRMVVIGVIGLAVASALCGLTPKGSVAEVWMITFRVLQGAAAALMFPAAVGIVVAAFPLRERGRAMAIFFGISGALTAIGPITGGYLTQWTWRSIFWINVPVAIIALILIRRSCTEETETQQTKLDYRGTVLITGAMGLIVLGLQQSGMWGWSSVRTWACIVVGLLLMVAFVAWELRTPEPLLRLQIFRDRGFAVETVVLGLISVVFIPFFFFASVYAQVSLGETSANAGLYIMYFFLGFVIMAQIGGRIPRPPRRQARSRRRLRARRGWVLPARRKAHGPFPERPVGLRDDRGRRDRPDARHRQHRRRQPRAEHPVQRGHRNHPDRPQLRREPWARPPRCDPHQRERHKRRRGADERGGAEGGGSQGRHIVHHRRWWSFRIWADTRSRARRTDRVRPLDPNRVLHHGRGDGRDIPDLAPLASPRTS
ncbi:MAG: MFS transporter [Solirubrobacteraceae bacterium]